MVTSRAPTNSSLMDELAIPTARLDDARAATCSAVTFQLNQPLTPALSPSDGERECSPTPVERSLFSDPIHTLANVLPLPFLKGEGRGEGSRPLHRYG